MSCVSFIPSHHPQVFSISGVTSRVERGGVMNFKNVLDRYRLPTGTYWFINKIYVKL